MKNEKSIKKRNECPAGEKDLPDIVRKNEPEAMRSKLQQVNFTPRNLHGTGQARPLCLLHFSDIHGDEKRLGRVLDFAAYYREYIRDVLHTGDSLPFEGQGGSACLGHLPGSEAILNVIGNHDVVTGENGPGFSMEESYHAYFAPYIENWGVVYEEGKTFYYKDYPENRIRLIVLDVIHQTEAQLAWFTNVLRDSRENRYHVLIALHARAHWSLDSIAESAWDDKPVVPWYEDGDRDSSASSQPDNLSDSYAKAVDAFLDEGGRFIAWIHGHVHFKMLATLSDHPRQLDIAVGTAAGAGFAWEFISARIEGTQSEDNFNILAADTETGMLRLLKVGVAYDYCARHIDTCCYDYVNHCIVSK